MLPAPVPARRAAACSIELPAGICDAHGEDPQLTAARELQEEVELQRRALAPPADASTRAPGSPTSCTTSTSPRGLSPRRPRRLRAARRGGRDGEDLGPVDDLLDAVLDGRVREGPLAAAVLAYDVLEAATVELA